MMGFNYTMASTLGFGSTLEQILIREGEEDMKSLGSLVRHL